ncbi:ABC transporter permease [Altererythrobacter sp. KTW20L]|uniref:ABC transporter permease n=1 Tax=Altererythrobacter sp. KTW20L TaxID=2942210 RepID=UPI0020C0A07E|nr:ABC transporter permease [Altererythrobacter sp. KTW20L]MCL6250224.1 ABC transporter permease [Altererythrobacter sp. KTW20L]
MSVRDTAGRLSLWRAAYVVARRDFTAILLSRAFIFFLLGPLFPIAVAVLAGGAGAQVQSEAAAANVGIAMSAEDSAAMIEARDQLTRQVGNVIPAFVALDHGPEFDPEEVLEGREGRLAAIVTGTLAAPELTAPPGNLARWNGTVSLIATNAANSASGAGPPAYPEVRNTSVTTSGASENRGRYQTAQGGQLLLFLLIMLLASMVLSNLVEEKGNKIIEILAAAVPMDAVFMGKLFAMLAISLVGIVVWGSVGTAGLLMTGRSLSEFANPGVGWPLFFTLGAIYFGMGYLLLGSVFLAVGSMAATVREVQTLAMPVTMAQVLVFFFATIAMTQTGSAIEYASIIFPLSSPFAMLARAAVDEAVWPHVIALAWQAVCVALFIHAGATLFRKRVMKAGSQGSGKSSRSLKMLLSGLFSAGSDKRA